MKTTLIILLAVLSGCAVTPVQLSSQSETSLCERYAATRDREIRRELITRVALNNSEWTGVDTKAIRIGMRPLAVICSWGAPTDINRTTVADNSTHEQWVYETYYGRTTGSRYKFVYFENGAVTAIQE